MHTQTKRHHHSNYMTLCTYVLTGMEGCSTTSDESRSVKAFRVCVSVGVKYHFYRNLDRNKERCACRTKSTIMKSRKRFFVSNVTLFGFSFTNNVAEFRYDDEKELEFIILARDLF